MQNRREFLYGIVGLAILLTTMPELLAERPGNARKPSIIYILADDLGYADLGCYGQQKIKTPEIDRLAQEGMKFTDHYAGNTVCAPSRCNLMTGKHPGHAYVRWNKEFHPIGQLPLPAEETTVPELLKKAGYATGAFGKWGLGFPGTPGMPNKQGFDEFYGYLCQRNAHHYWVDKLFHNGEQVHFDEKIYSHDLTADKALEFIREHRDQPFFLYVPFCIPHTRFEVPELGIYADKDWPEKMKIRAAMISRMDRDVGRILALLKKLGLDDDTLVMFASDNGSHDKSGSLKFFDSNRISADKELSGHKRSFYEGGIRVPFVARWPGRIEEGGVTDHTSAFWDILPTFCDLAGVEPPKDSDGISFLPTLLGKDGDQKLHEALYWEMPHHRGGQAVRMGKWKGIRHNTRKGNVEMELYNLEEDIEEQDNVADGNPEVVARIEKIMEREHTPSQHFKLLPDE